MLFSKSTISRFVTRRKLARLKFKIESEETFLNLSYFLQSNAAQQSAVIMQGESLKKRKKPACASSSLILILH